MNIMQKTMAAAVFLSAAGTAEAQLNNPSERPYNFEREFNELPAYARCAVRAAKSAMPADFRLSVIVHNKIADDGQPFLGYAVKIRNPEKLEYLHMYWEDIRGRHADPAWPISYASYDDDPPYKENHESGVVKGYMGGYTSELFDVYAAQLVNEERKPIPAINITRAHAAIVRQCNAIG